MAIDYTRDDDDPTSDYDDTPPSHASLKHIAPQSTVFNPPTPAAQPAATEVKIDHRKKRRNRTTQSCLSCHQNKRKVILTLHLTFFRVWICSPALANAFSFFADFSSTSVIVVARVVVALLLAWCVNIPLSLSTSINSSHLITFP